MLNYKYEGTNNSGEKVEGIVEAIGKEDALTLLNEKGYSVSNIEEQSDAGLFEKDLFEMFNKVDVREVARFARIMAVLLHSGMTLIRSFQVLIKQTENKKFKKVLENISVNLEEGVALSDAMRKHSSVFSNLFVSTVRVGEETGHLDEIFDKISVFLDKDIELKEKVKSALSYPIMLVSVSISVVSFLIFFVFPKFVKIFSRSGTPLPLPTKILFDFGQFVLNNWMYIFIVILGIGVWFYNLKRSENGQMAIDEFKLKVPIAGPLFREVAISRFCKSLEIMIRSGLNVVDSFEIVKDNVGNKVISRSIDEIIKDVKEGEKITTAMEKSGEFPDMVIQMIAIGEETGALELSLSNIAEDYDRRVDYAIKTMTALIEPVLVVFMGGLIAFISVSLFLPMFDMMKTF